MKDLLFVFLGGGIGSILRYSVGLSLPKYIHGFPWNTFIVNIVGSFLMGVFYSLLNNNSSKFTTQYSTLLMAGFCGGFTTFSALSLECFSMLQKQQYILLVQYVTLTIILGILAIFIGYKLCNSI